MKISSQIKSNAIKGVIAFFAITLMIVLAAKDGGSTLSSLKIGLIFLALTVGAILIGLPLIIASATFDQFMIRNGAVDTSWYWFDSDSPGLAALKAQVQANKEIRNQ